MVFTVKEKNYFPNGVGTMRLKTFLYFIVICISIVLFQYLYQKQLGAISFFLISFSSFYLAYREKKNQENHPFDYENQYKE